MNSIDNLLDTIKHRHKLNSDYKLSLFLGIGQGNIANYRHKRSMPNVEACEKIAKALDMDPDVLIVYFEAQRAQTNEARARWVKIGHRLQSGASQAAVIAVVAMISVSGFAPNAEATALVPSSTKYTSYKVKS